MSESLSKRPPRADSTVGRRLRISESVAGTQRTVRLDGELDLATSHCLDDAIGALALDEEEFVLDLSNLRFIDSSGLHLILRLQERCRQRHRRLLLASPSRQVQRVFEIAGVSIPTQEVRAGRVRPGAATYDGDAAR